MRGTLIERLLGRFSYVRELEKGFDHLLDEIRERDARIAELTKRPGLEVILKAAALDLLVRMASREPGQYPKAFSLADTCLAVGRRKGAHRSTLPDGKGLRVEKHTAQT